MGEAASDQRQGERAVIHSPLAANHCQLPTDNYQHKS
ncbi:hypothetical protein SAMN05720469_103126 [Fibrobacter intestinalis]|uniref:Uncharacterized protein n=1 Tax=Fibrobacter intestinalis TaxID=28122 RepID=A0A1M6R6K6_9BACT|nr:hypothetical protein SAMN05720469_103126 [Fibrobacter intestinalis]